jgi:hypothetical protein
MWPLSPGTPRLPAIYCRRIVMLTLHLLGCKRRCRTGISRFRFPGSRPGACSETRNEQERGGAVGFRFFLFLFASFTPRFSIWPVLRYTHRHIHSLSPPCTHTKIHMHPRMKTHTYTYTYEKSFFSFSIFSQENSGPADYNPTGFSILALLICG